MSGLQHKVASRPSSGGRGFGGGVAPNSKAFFLTGPERGRAFCFGPVQCPSRSVAEAAVPPACPRRGKRERGRIKFLAAAGELQFMPLAYVPEAAAWSRAWW